jgi:hypothetical protein
MFPAMRTPLLTMIPAVRWRAWAILFSVLAGLAATWFCFNRNVVQHGTKGAKPVIVNVPNAAPAATAGQPSAPKPNSGPFEERQQNSEIPVLEVENDTDYHDLLTFDGNGIRFQLALPPHKTGRMSLLPGTYRFRLHGGSECKEVRGTARFKPYHHYETAYVLGTGNPGTPVTFGE